MNAPETFEEQDDQPEGPPIGRRRRARRAA